MATKQKKEVAKQKAIKGGMPSEVADNVFRMQMGKREIDSPGTFSTKQSKIMQMAPLGPMLQTENENGMKEVGRNTTSTEKMVQGLLGEETNTTIDLASDPTTTTTTGTRSLDEAFDIAQNTGLTLPGETREAYKIRARKDPSFGQNTQYEKEVETPGETAQKKETEFNPYPFKDTYDPFEARQEGRNIKATQRKLKREKIREARAQAKVDGKKGKEKREAVKAAKAQAKLDQRKATKKGMQDIATSVSTQVEKGKNPAQTDSYQAKPNEDPVMPMKPMQFRKVGYSGRKPGKSGYKK